MRTTMPVPTSPADVEQALNATGNGWLLMMGDPGPILEKIAAEVDEFIGDCEARYRTTPDPLGLVRESPERATAFFELLTNPTVSRQMRIAVWNLINGAEIQGLTFEYERDRPSNLTIRLVLENGKTDSFSGDSVWDFEVLRHIAILSAGGRTILDGFYASYLPEQQATGPPGGDHAS
jgi:hypothetical protein